MEGFTDLHCHILPALDDGAGSMEKTRKMLKIAYNEGIRQMIATPHFYPSRKSATVEEVQETLRKVQEKMSAWDFKIRLYAGNEIYYHNEVPELLENGKVGTLAGGRYVLVEFDPDVLYSGLRNAVRSLVSSGYYPIVAHYERYRCLKENTERLMQLRYDGAMLQMNFDTLLIKGGLFHRNPWRGLLKDGYVDFLGSDTHGMDFRPPHIGKAVEWMDAEVDPWLKESILERNIQLLLNP